MVVQNESNGMQKEIPLIVLYYNLGHFGPGIFIIFHVFEDKKFISIYLKVKIKSN